MPSIGTLSLRIPVWSPTLIGWDFPLTTLIGITSKRKQFLTYTQKTARPIQDDQKITSRHAEVLTRLKDS
jgi:hypothetical protein